MVSFFSFIAYLISFALIGIFSYAILFGKKFNYPNNNNNLTNSIKPAIPPNRDRAISKLNQNTNNINAPNTTINNKVKHDQQEQPVTVPIIPPKPDKPINKLTNTNDNKIATNTTPIPVAITPLPVQPVNNNNNNVEQDKPLPVTAAPDITNHTLKSANSPAISPLPVIIAASPVQLSLQPEEIDPIAFDILSPPRYHTGVTNNANAANVNISDNAADKKQSSTTELDSNLIPNISYHIEPEEQIRINNQVKQATLKLHQEQKQDNNHVTKLPPINENKPKSSANTENVNKPNQPNTNDKDKPSVVDAIKVESEEELAKKKAHRSQVCAEIISSELKYLISLQTLMSAYLAPMKQKSLKGDLKISATDLSTIFSNIEAIIQFHDTFAKELQATNNQPGNNNTNNIAFVFNKYSAFLKTYIQYTNNYDNCIQIVNNLSSNSAFKKFLKKQREDKISGGMDLMSYLIMPIQRIPRYELLLRELLRYTPNNDPQYTDLNLALDKIKSIASTINEKKRQMESLSTLLDLSHKITNMPDSLQLFQPTRKLVRTGLLVQKTSTKDVNSIFILFNDILVWTSESYEFQGFVKLIEVKIESTKHLLNTIEVYSEINKKKGLFIQCANKDEHISWLSSLIECRDNQVRNEKSKSPDNNHISNNNINPTHHRQATTSGLIQDALKEVIQQKKAITK